MKRVIITIALLLTLTAGQAQQQVSREGNTFSVVTTKKRATETKTQFEWQDAKGNKYPIYVGKTGACYIKRISRNGNEYKKYLGAEVSAQVCRELGIEYKPTKSK